MNKDKTLETIEKNWDSWFIPGLSDFIAVDNLTLMVDPEYFTNGKVEKAMDLVDSYINKLDIQGLSKKIYRAETGAPMVVYVVEPTEGVTNNVLIYGHLDKQPYGEGWWEDTPPNKPTLKGDLLYGRGGGDDGYAPFSAMLAVKAGQEQGAKMPRIALVLETEEESGSPNLLALLDQAKDFIGSPDYMFCMDSGCFD
jgi:acetylornithine deacetylase/succinyl-diaminopimelate desuccinylase-like protein